MKAKTLPKTIRLRITPADAAKAKWYTDNCNCLLATATKRQLLCRKIDAGSDMVSIGYRDYFMSAKDADKILHCYDGERGVATVRCPFTVTLCREPF